MPAGATLRMVWMICRKFIVIVLSDPPWRSPLGRHRNRRMFRTPPQARASRMGASGGLGLRLGRGRGAPRGGDHNRHERRDGLRDGGRQGTGDHRRQRGEQVHDIRRDTLGADGLARARRRDGALGVSLAAMPAGETVCWLSVVPTWPASTMPALTA